MCIDWCSLLLYCFFFFKQKTAYEMRISDWSSDVCSSDLLDLRGVGPTVPCAPLLPALSNAPPVVPQEEGFHRVEQDGGAHRRPRRPADCRQIGRASCRERVCQYV